MNNVYPQSRKTKSLKQWYDIMGHCNVRNLVELESLMDGMYITAYEKFKCETCIQDKMVESRNQTVDEKSSNNLDLIHTDLVGPVFPCSKEGSKHSIVFTDNYTGVIFVYFLKKKSDAAKATAKFIADIAHYD